MRRPHRETESRLSIRFAPKPVRLTRQRRNADFVLIKTRPYLIARLRADIERIVEFLLENKPAISWAEAGWSF